MNIWQVATGYADTKLPSNALGLTSAGGSAYNNTEITLSEKDTFYSLFAEQSIDLENYSISGT